MTHHPHRSPPWYTGKGMVWLLSGIALWGIPHLFAALPKPAPTPVSLSGTTPCDNAKVLDGDTIQATCAGQRLTLRLVGIDAPEMGQAPYGEEARAALARRLPPHFHADIHGNDRYGRSLAVLHDAQGDINEWLLHQGVAIVYRRRDAPAAYLAAENAAKRAKRGLWRHDGDQQNPQNWRRYHL
ncbi:MAG: thermonuclease family protein [Cardiobacteriaceae bacterium]|nr:thermonuclease family protein [Cardiobacteriaceae bacterium]